MRVLVCTYAPVAYTSKLSVFARSPTPYPLTKQSPGIIPSPLSTTALQVLTRVIQVWMVWYCFPSSTSSSAAYPALVLAWSAADAVRYVYLAANLHGRAGPALGWVR